MMQGPVALTLVLALSTTLLLLLLGSPIAWWLAQTKHPLKPWIEAVVALPLVLPPVVLGFYLLILLGAQGPLAWLWPTLGIKAPVFQFSGLLIGSALYSLPFVVQPLQSAFESLGRAPLEAAATLGAGVMDRFLHVVLPMSKRGFLVASVLGFAHTVGEFGVVLMIGGNIPGRTRVLSIAIYDHVETLNYAAAHRLSFALLLFSFLVLLSVYALNRRYRVGLS